MSSTSHTQKDARVLLDIARFELTETSRYRVYPRLPSQTVTLATAVGADAYGDWVEIVPANTVPFGFLIPGLVIETITATAIYILQIGNCAAGLEPTGNDIDGEVRFRGVTPIPKATAAIPFGCRGILANRRVMGRVMNDSGGDSITISVTIARHIEVTKEIEMWPVFPW